MKLGLLVHKMAFVQTEIAGTVEAYKETRHLGNLLLKMEIFHWGFQFTFFLNPYGLNIMERGFVFLGNNFLFKYILTHCVWYPISHATVVAISVWTNPILCTKSPNFTMLFYYIKMQTSSSPYHPFLQLTGALKWGTVWISISNGVETTPGQSKSFDIYVIKNKLLTLTMHSFYTSWDRSSYSMSF